MTLFKEPKITRMLNLHNFTLFNKSLRRMTKGYFEYQVAGNVKIIWIVPISGQN